MRKIIAIGESVLDTIFRGGKPIEAFVGGRVANAAASLATMGVPCTMVSECTTDSVGDIIVHFLTAHGVDVTSVDRYPDGATRLSAIFVDNDKPGIVNYGEYPKDRFNVVWPRIDEDDVILIGSLYAVDLPQRDRLYDLLKHAVERKAIIVYLPGLQHGINFRITHVMPHLLENLEISQLVIATRHDLDTIFPGESASECYRNHIRFYDNTFIYIDENLHETIYCGDNTFSIDTAHCPTHELNMLGWQSGLTAGIIHGLIKREVTHESITTIGATMWQEIINEAHGCAGIAASSSDHCVNHALKAQTTAQS